MDDYFQTLPGRRFLKKLTDFYKDHMEPKDGFVIWDGEYRNKDSGNWIECPYCKNTGKHLCPDVAEPVLIKCTHKQCPVVLLEDNKRMFNALANDGRFSEDMDRIKQLEFAIDRFRHHVGWARTQDNLRSTHNCLETGWNVLIDILDGKTPVPENFEGLKNSIRL